MLHNVRVGPEPLDPGSANLNQTRSPKTGCRMALQPVVTRMFNGGELDHPFAGEVVAAHVMGHGVLHRRQLCTLRRTSQASGAMSPRTG